MSEFSKDQPVKIFGDRRSGNCYKVQLLMELLGLPYQWVAVDVLKGETRNAEFLAMNPNGKVPIIEYPDGTVLAESNAILLHLAEGSGLLPENRLTRARVYQWLFFEQYSHEPYIAVARFIVVYLGQEQEQAERLTMLRDKGHAALQVMEHHLAGQEFITDQFSVADIALYAYTHCAGEAGIELALYPRIQAWLKHVEGQPRFIPMQAG